jgi:hypothetical protein
MSEPSGYRAFKHLDDVSRESGIVMWNNTNLIVVLRTLYMMFIEHVRGYMSGFSDEEFKFRYEEGKIIIKINIETVGIMTVITLLYIVGHGKDDILCEFVFDRSEKELTINLGSVGDVPHLLKQMMRHLNLRLAKEIPAVDSVTFPDYIFWEYLLTDEKKREATEKEKKFDEEFGHIESRELPRTLIKFFVEFDGIKYNYIRFFKIDGTDEPVDFETIFIQTCHNHFLSE